MQKMRRQKQVLLWGAIVFVLLFSMPAEAQLCQAVEGMEDRDSLERLRHPRRNIDTEYILFQPPQLEEGKKYPLFIYLHGEGDRIEELGRRYCKLINQADMFIAFPRGPLYVRSRGRVGYGWFVEGESDILVSLQNANQMVTLMIRNIKKKYPQLDDSKVSIGGFSQGARTALYIGLKNPKRFAKIMSVAGQYMSGFFDRLAKRAAGEVEVFIHHGEKDRVNPLPPMKAGFYEMERLGVDVDLKIYPRTHQITKEIMGSVLGEAENY